MTLKILVVEDEFAMLMDIKRKLINLGYDVTGANSYEEAIISIIENEPDLLILDINLGGTKNGIDLAQNITKKYDLPFIFLTASSDAKTFESASKVNPLGFIIKPFKLEDLRNNIELAYRNFQAIQSNNTLANKENSDNLSTFFIKQNGVIQQINIDQVTHIEAMDNYVRLFTLDKKYVINITLKEILAKLPTKDFVRIHKSYIVACSQIKSIEGNSLYLMSGQVLSIGKTFRDDLMKSIQLL